MFMFSGRSEEKQRQNEQMNRSSCLTAALCEACINTALALSLSPAEFKKVERKPPMEKWLVDSKRVNPKFSLDPESPLGQQLAFIIACRNSITHAQPEVYSETKHSVINKCSCFQAAQRRNSGKMSK